jgi:CRP-like cAMP-binding protein
MISEDVLARFSPFNQLTVHHLLDALDALEPLRLPPGAFLFKRGKELVDAYFLLEGTLDLIDHQFASVELQAGSPEALEAVNPAGMTQVTARATTPVLGFSINRDYLTRLLSYSVSGDARYSTPESAAQLLDDDAWFGRLLESHVFAQMPMAQVQQLFTRLRAIPVKAGEKIIREGEQGDYFYVLAKGQALITNALGTLKLHLNPGAFFGEEALLGKALRNASVTMLTDGVLKRLNEADFDELVRQPSMQYIPVEDVEKLAEPFCCIDVKMPVEFRLAHFPGAINIPLARLREQARELESEHLYLIPDDADGRSEIAAHILCQRGLSVRIIKDARQMILGASGQG